MALSFAFSGAAAVSMANSTPAFAASSNICTLGRGNDNSYVSCTAPVFPYVPTDDPSGVTGSMSLTNISSVVIAVQGGQADQTGASGYITTTDVPAGTTLQPGQSITFPVQLSTNSSFGPPGQQHYIMVGVDITPPGAAQGIATGGAIYTITQNPPANQPPPPAPTSSTAVVGMANTPDGKGYWIARQNGAVQNFGDAPSLGNASGLTSPVAGIAAASSGNGYFLVTQAGQVYAFGTAAYHGGVPSSTALAKPIVGMAVDPATGGYWLLGGDGGVFTYDAPFYGSTGNIRLGAPAVGMLSSPSGKGYYFVAADGGVFAYGDARFQGSVPGVLAPGQHLNKPVVGIAADSATGGYWMDASDGGIFSFNAPFYGSTGNINLAQPCVGMASMPDGHGYRFVAADGGIFDFGDAGFYGSGA